MIITKRCFVSSLVENGPVVLEKKVKCEKFTITLTTTLTTTKTTTTTTDNDGQRTNFDQRSSLEPSGSGDLKNLKKRKKMC